jgi:hypothetical protein
MVPLHSKGRGERSKEKCLGKARGRNKFKHAIHAEKTPAAFPVTVPVFPAQVLRQHVPPRAKPPPHHPPRGPHNPRLHQRARSAPFEPPELPAAPKIPTLHPPSLRIPHPGQSVPGLFRQEILPPGLVSPAVHARNVSPGQSSQPAGGLCASTGWPRFPFPIEAGLGCRLLLTGALPSGTWQLTVLRPFGIPLPTIPNSMGVVSRAHSPP